MKKRIIPIPENKDIFQLRQSCRQIDDRKRHSINPIQCRLRSSIFGALTRSNVTLFVTFGISLLLVFFSVMLFADVTEDKLLEHERVWVEHVKNSIARAEQLQSKLNRKALRIEGMSSPKVRHLLNNLCSKPDTHYLEIGVWKGSTFIASLFNNHETVISGVAIDNWSEWSGPKEQFHKNVNSFLSQNNYAFFEADSFQIDPKKVCSHPINIYFYDGWHGQREQELALTYYHEVFDSVFVYIVDDWNWESVKTGTKDAIEKLNYEILFERELPARFNGDKKLWWNGIYIAVLRKTNIF